MKKHLIALIALAIMAQADSEYVCYAGGYGKAPIKVKILKGGKALIIQQTVLVMKPDNTYEGMGIDGSKVFALVYQDGEQIIVGSPGERNAVLDCEEI